MASESDVLIQVQANGFTAYCDTFRYQSWGEILLLSMFGPRNAVRSAWATLVDGKASKRNKTMPSLSIGGVNARRAPEPYSTINAPLGSAKVLHCLVVNRRATRGGESETNFVQFGPNADQRFFPRLSRICPVPMRPAWAPQLWELGQQVAEGVPPDRAAIVPAAGHGLPVYTISTVAEVWHTIVRDGIQSGILR